VNRSRALLLVLGLGVGAYVGLPYLPDGAEMLSGATSARTEAAGLRTKSAAASAAVADESKFAPALAAARAAVPRDAELPSLITDLEQVVRDAGMTWSSGSPSAAGGTAEAPVWSMTLTLSGPARRVPDLLDGIGSLERLVVVDSVQVRGDIDASIVLSVRFFAAAGSPDSFPGAAGDAAGGD
jgi:Tfp pilus assembly protein PilO